MMASRVPRIGTPTGRRPERRHHRERNEPGENGKPVLEVEDVGQALTHQRNHLIGVAATKSQD
jgi:hypothetical protein